MRLLRENARQGTYIENLLETELAQSSLSGPDRSLLQELTFGVTRWEAALDWLIARKTENRKQPLPTQILLRLALYQLFFLDRIPDHAVVYETVELAKDARLQAGFVNALLRGYVRERESTRASLLELRQRDPALGYSHPAWLCDRWEKRWGREALIQLLQWNNAPPPLYARVNTLRTNAEALLAQWKEEEVRAIPKEFDWAEGIFELKTPGPLTHLASFQQGHFYVQDPSTLLSVRVMDPQPGESILDYCAAPGGKTTYIAQRMGNQGYIMAQDLDLRRRNLISENCRRLGVRIATVSRATTTVNVDLSNPFDRILVDAPCSNSGVLRRRIGARWRLTPEELARQARVQLDLLDRCCRQLGRGGALVYSTCSLEPEENADLIRQFCAGHPQFTLELERELVPTVEGVDGAYVARLRLTDGTSG